MITFVGTAEAVVMSHENFSRWNKGFFQKHHLAEQLLNGEQYHILPVELLEVYELSSFRAGGYEPWPAAIFAFDPQHNLFAHLSFEQREHYHIAIIGEARLYVVQRREWFLEQAKADFQS